jgi:hypothetical protein
LDHIIFQVYPLTLRFKFAESVNLGVACFTGAFHPDLVQPTRSCVMGELYPFAQLSEMNSQSILWVNLGVACFTGAFHPDLVQPTRSCVMGELYPFAQLSEMNSQSILWVNLLELLSNQDWSDY